MSIDYSQQDMNLLTRGAVPASFREFLNANPAWAGWRSLRQTEPALQFWLNSHNQFLKTISQIEAVTKALVLGQAKDMGGDIRRSNLLEGTQQLIIGFQEHQSVEDVIYFPKFVTLFPRLKAPFEMLDQDHIILGQLLDDASGLLDKLAVAKPALADVTALLMLVQTLRRAMVRHIRDEEDIVMPEVLEVGLDKILAV